MVKNASLDVSGRLVRLKARFASWRKQRSRGERIPDALWNAAVNLAAEIGVNQTAKALTLDYYGLRRRLAALDQEPPTPTFIELPTSAIGDVTASSECMIELEDSGGARMRMHVKGLDSASLALLGHRLWNAK